MKRKTLMSWSSGKDSAWALYKLQQDPEIDITGLFCTLNTEFDRVAMHGVRAGLLQKQAESIGLPLEIIGMPWPCSNAEYEKIMGQFVEKAKSNNIEYFAFGDLFLEDVRSYREDKLRNSGIKPVFPVWGMPTDELSREMIRCGMRTIITCVDPKHVPEDLAGHEFNENFLDALPGTADPCGENGEFHSFVFDGPMFQERVEVVVGDIVRRDDFVYADVLPKNA